MIKSQEALMAAVRNVTAAWREHEALPTFDRWKALEAAMDKLDEIRREIELQR